MKVSYYVSIQNLYLNFDMSTVIFSIGMYQKIITFLQYQIQFFSKSHTPNVEALRGEFDLKLRLFNIFSRIIKVPP